MKRQSASWIGRDAGVRKVIVWLPSVSKVAMKVPTPLVNVVSAKAAPHGRGCC